MNDKTLHVGVQLFGVRDHLRADPTSFANVMSYLKSTGYEGVEFAGLYGLPPEYVREVLTELDLMPVSAHVPFTELEEDPVKVAQTYSKIGCRYIAIPNLPAGRRYTYPGYEGIVETIVRCAEVMKDHGIIFLFHNHDFDFLRLPDGTVGIEDIFSRVPRDLLKAEPDTCWLHSVGKDVVAYINRFKGNCPIVHLKDVILIGGDEEHEGRAFKGELEFQPVGFGQLIWEPILNAAREAGTEWVIVEDESPVIPSFECARRSREYLRILGL